MRIGKITLDGYFNYGNLLQNYALQQVLLRYATKVDTLWHTEDNFLPQTYWQWTWKQPVKYLINWKNFRTDFFSGLIGYEMVRQGNLKDWADRYIYFRKDVKELSKVIDEYDYFVTGSDQVWNPYFNNNAYLQEKDIQTAVADKSKVVVIPVFRAFESDRPLLWDSANMWLRTWQQRPLSAGLIEIIPIPDTPISRAEIDAEKALTYDVAALREVALNNNANDVYVADAVFDGIEGLKVTLTSLKSDKAAEVIRVPGDRNMSEFLLAHGADEVVKQIENKIKNVNLAQSRVQSSIAAIFNFQKLSDWVKAEKQLKSIPYVKKVQVDAMGNGKVQLKIDFVGTDERIWSALRNKGFNLKQFDDFYLLEY